METRVLIPSGALGLGYDREALARGVARGPDIIAIDGGSTDSGPAYLGRGVSKYSRSSTKSEWRELMQARAQAGVPLLVGTAGTCGSDSAVDWLFEITKEIAGELDQNLRVARLFCGQETAATAQALSDGRLSALEGAPEIDAQILSSCTNIVALAGAEQIQAALATRADIVIAGRSTDTGVIAALPLAKGAHPGAAWHGAKVGECGAIATTEPGSGVIEMVFDETGFTMTPLGETARATPQTVSAHMLYENTDPYILYEPGGYLDVREAAYTALDNKRVRVEGSKWVPGAYSVKLEGARITGHQVASLAILRDARYVENSQAWVEDVARQCREKVVARLGIEDFEIELRRIGADATLGALETQTSTAHEIGVLAIVTAQTEAIAQEIAKMLNPYLLHHPLVPEEPMPTFAFPFSPPEMSRGPAYAFCLHHVLALSDPMEAFRLEVSDL